MEAYIVFERSVRSSSRLVRRWSKHVRDRFDLPSGTFSDDFLSTSFTVSSELVAKQLPERSVLAHGAFSDRFSTLNFTVPSQLVTEQVPDRADLAHGTGFRTLNFTVPSQLVTEQVPIGPIGRFRDIRNGSTDEHRFSDPPTQ